MTKLSKERLQFMRDELKRLQSAEELIFNNREAHVRNIFFGWSITFTIIGVLIKVYKDESFLLSLGLSLSFGLGFLMSTFLFLRLLNNIVELSTTRAQKFMARKYFEVKGIAPPQFSFADIKVAPKHGDEVFKHCNAFTPRTNLFAKIYILGTAVLFLFPVVISGYLTIIFFLGYRIVNQFLVLSPIVILATIVAGAYFYFIDHHYKETRKLSNQNLERMLSAYKETSIYQS